jgi:hypothetical protein
MSETTAFDVLNRLVSEGKIANYAIAGRERSWRGIGPAPVEAARLTPSAFE